MKLGGLRDVQSRTGTTDNRAVSLTVKDIPVGDIQIKENIRREYSGLEELQASIREHGLIQPITVYKEGDSFIVKIGHRRYMAYQRLAREDPDRFHSIRCIVSASNENTAVIQLVENVQRVDLTTLDLYQALSTLRNQNLTNQQIAEVMGKSEGYIKNLFVAINELNASDWLKDYLESHVNMTFQDVIDTKGIADKTRRLGLLEQRTAGEIGQKALREMVKAAKADHPSTKPPAAIPDSPSIPSSTTVAALHTPAVPVSTESANRGHTQVDPIPGYATTLSLNTQDRPEPLRIQVSIIRNAEQRSISVCPVNAAGEEALISIENDLSGFFAAYKDKYRLV